MNTKQKQVIKMFYGLLAVMFIPGAVMILFFSEPEVVEHTDTEQVSTVMFVNHGGKCYIVDAVDMDFYQEINCNPDITNLIDNTPVGHGITTNYIFFGQDPKTGECFSAVGAGVNKEALSCTDEVLALVIEGAEVIE